MTTSDDYVWTIDKALTLKGGPGTWKWTRVLFAAKTVSLRWKATPAGAAGCAFKYRLESASLPKAVGGSAKASTSKAVGGSKNATIKYGDGVVTITSDCASWSLSIVPTGHPGVVIKRTTETTKTAATTAAGLNEALADSQADWDLGTNYNYSVGGTYRIVSLTVTVHVTDELPAWTAPSGTDPALIAAWTTALAGMKRHTQGEAAIAVQSAGRYLASITKRSFTSFKAMDTYLDQLADKTFDWYDAKSDTYNENTMWGETQDAYIP
ncbi:MAG: hypothetical protein A2Z32_04795 [Chloroflexi bacterium RBG_16_69_14]|nr:MAG: hypothetical protein A2Z32_04795 [Chloroflexi bacterium RBG_16_69_14]